MCKTNSTHKHNRRSADAVSTYCKQTNKQTHRRFQGPGCSGVDTALFLQDVAPETQPKDKCAPRRADGGGAGFISASRRLHSQLQIKLTY